MVLVLDAERSRTEDPSLVAEKMLPTENRKPLVQWKSEYSVGIDAVDYEHRQLIDLINRLSDELGAKGSKTTTSAFFGDLLKGISAHFALEERFMQERGYDQFGPHKADHERLLDDLRDMMDAFEEVEEIDADKLTTELDTWFTHHFQTHDAKLHQTLGVHPS